MKCFVWHISEGDVDVGRCLDDRFVVREGIEALFPVVVSHAGVAYAAERHVFVCQVHDDVVDACPAGRSESQYIFAFLFLSEIVES